MASQAITAADIKFYRWPKTKLKEYVICDKIYEYLKSFPILKTYTKNIKRNNNNNCAKETKKNLSKISTDVSSNVKYLRSHVNRNQ